jgi:hypothetical protein
MRSESNTRDGHERRVWVNVARRGIASASILLLVGTACGHSSEMGFGGAATDGGDTFLSVDGGGSSSGGGFAGDDGSAGSHQGLLAITPVAPVVTVVTGGAVPTVQFALTVAGKPATASSWRLDQGALGKISATGLFTPTGTIAGVGNVTASYGGSTATTTVTVNIQTTDKGDPAYVSNPPPPGPGGYGGVGGNGPGAPPTSSQVSTLNGAPQADSTVRLLYPYDGTVWPQALLAPLLQWTPGSHSFDSVYVHIQEKHFEYKGYFAANATPFMNVPIPQAAWTAMGYSNGGEPVTVSLVFGQGGTAYGPYAETWTVAQGALQGTIYYNSYGTSLVLNSDTPDFYGKQYGAGTLAIAPGGAAPTLVAGVPSVNAPGNGSGCRVCHTASADGKTLVTQASDSAATIYAPTEFISLTNDTTGGAGTPLASTSPPKGTADLAFPALYRDGSLLFSNAAVMNGPASANLIPGDGTSKLYSLPAGNLVPGVTGLPAGFGAGLPSFSPDGTHLSFNFWGGTFPGATGDQVSLGVIDFDANTKAFSNPRVVYTPPNVSNGEPAVIYSSFLPSSSAIVFEQELSNGGDVNDWGYTWAGSQPALPTGHTSELWWLDLPSKTPHRLDQLNGYRASGSVYLPSGTAHTAAQDATLNYEPTVTPISAGGYAWIVFTSRRLYGNVATLPPWTSDPTLYKWHDPGNVTPKKLWVAAVDLNAPPGKDASHPAFYLPGQELYAGNSRGYWTVPPCRQNGSSCEVGDQCCGGFCEAPEDGGGGLVCTAQKPTCSAQYEKCSKTSDCCGATSGIQCINNVCSLYAPSVQ